MISGGSKGVVRETDEKDWNRYKVKIEAVLVSIVVMTPNEDAAFVLSG